MRGFSEGKSDASKQAMTFRLSQNSNFFYTVLANRFFYLIETGLVALCPFGVGLEGKATGMSNLIVLIV